MFDLISKHFDLEKRHARSIKKINRRVENDKKKQNSKWTHGRFVAQNLVGGAG